MANKKKTWLIIGGIALAAIIIGAIAGGDDGKSSQAGAAAASSEVAEAAAPAAPAVAETAAPAAPAVEEPDDTLPVKTLTSAYDDNEVAAKRQYKGKKFRFKGRITDIGESLGKPYVHLDYQIGVHFYFRDSDVVANLKKGDKVKIEGVVGTNLGTLISIDNCKLVE